MTQTQIQTEISNKNLLESYKQSNINKRKKHSKFLNKRFENDYYLTNPKTNVQKLPNGNTIDWNRGLLWQLKYVDKYYDEWLEHPRMTRARLFDSNILESLSFTAWWVVPCLYFPWSMLELMKGYKILNNYFSFIIFLCGIFLWTFFEYWCHRKAFHWSPPSPKWNILHFIGHGLHHITPLDKFRLVFPPAISVPLGFFFKFLYGNLFPPGISNCVWAGFVFGYTCYESSHYYAHHNAFCKYLEKLHLYHSQHHFHPQKKDALYGVSSQLWDYVFGTLK